MYYHVRDFTCQSGEEDDVEARDKKGLVVLSGRYMRLCASHARYRLTFIATRGRSMRAAGLRAMLLAMWIRLRCLRHPQLSARSGV